MGNCCSAETEKLKQNELHREKAPIEENQRAPKEKEEKTVQKKVEKSPQKKPQRNLNMMKARSVRFDAQNAFTGGESFKTMKKLNEIKEEKADLLSFVIKCANHIPLHKATAKLSGGKSFVGKHGYYVKLSVTDKVGNHKYKFPISSRIVERNEKRVVEFDIHVTFPKVELTDVIKITLVATYYGNSSRKRVGRTFISVGDLVQKEKWDELWLFDTTNIAIFNTLLTNPCYLEVEDVSLNKPSSTQAVSIEDVEPELENTNDESKEDTENLKIDESPSNTSGKGRSHEKLVSILNDDDDDSNLDYNSHSEDEDGSEDDDHEKNNHGFGHPDKEVENMSKRNLLGIDSGLTCSVASSINANKIATITEEPSEVSVMDEPSPSVDEGIAEEKKPKHVLVITRGTRGDVQPFIALALGLAKTHGWHVTLCTELRYRGLIRRYKEDSGGRLHFRPSGGDTETRLEGALAKWGVQSTNRLINAAALARTEREFFDSEPAFYYWAKTLKPDYLCFTFTTTNLGLIISESLKIPCLGFFFQPTVIPSKHYPAILPLRMENFDDKVNQKEVHGLESHKMFRFIKGWFENNIFTKRIEHIRKLRGVPLTREVKKNFQVNDVERLVEGNYPLIMPIKKEAFGGYPSDWPKSFQMTDFIFLRSGATPPLSDEMKKFIAGAREANCQIMCICFSSMPVSRIEILELSLLILKKCPKPYKPAILALVGNRPLDEPTKESLEVEAKKYIAQDRLLIQNGAPYSKLFPEMDFIITHGGLGSTAEALATGKPLLVAGVLLLDQRFWGKRTNDLGVAPLPKHIRYLNKEIIGLLPKCLDPNGEYAANAKKLQLEMFPGGLENMSDGVEINVKAFKEACDTCKPANLEHEKDVAVEKQSMASMTKLHKK